MRFKHLITPPRLQYSVVGAFFMWSMLGCPVYEQAATTTTQECKEGANVSSEAPCPCKGKIPLIKTGDPVPGQDPNAIPRRGGSLRIHLDANLPSLNTARNNDSWIVRIVRHYVYQGLIMQDPADYSITPALATDWSSNDTETEWTFHLRKDVKWHDGQPFTSQDVKTTFDIFLNPNNQTEVLRADWQDILDPRKPYETPDDFTFIIRLKKPVALFFSSLNDVMIMPHHIFSRGDFNNHPNLRNPIGTGPYRFKEWTAESIVIERNLDYWGQPAYIDSLTYVIINDRDTAFAMVKRGDLDFMWRLMSHHRNEGITPDLLEKYNLIDLLPSNDFGFWLFNVQRPQFDDARVRQAMSMLIDRQQIICEIYQCLAEAVTGPTPRSHPGYDFSIPNYPYSPEKAAALLTEAGWIDRDGDGVREREKEGKVVPMRFTFMLTSSSRSLEQVVTVVQNAARRVGVDIQITKIDWSVFTDRLRKFDFDVVSFIYGGVHEPDHYGLFHSLGGQNYGKWSMPEADILTDKSRFIMDAAIRNLTLVRLHKILYDEQPYAFTFVQAVPALLRKDVQGVITSDLWYQEYDWWINDPSLPEVPPEQRHPRHAGSIHGNKSGRF